jgi:hypothetical protein
MSSAYPVLYVVPFWLLYLKLKLSDFSDIWRASVRLMFFLKPKREREEGGKAALASSTE